MIEISEEWHVQSRCLYGCGEHGVGEWYDRWEGTDGSLARERYERLREENPRGMYRLVGESRLVEQWIEVETETRDE